MMLSLKDKDRPVIRKLLAAGCCGRCVLRFCCVGKYSSYQRSCEVCVCDTSCPRCPLNIITQSLRASRRLGMFGVSVSLSTLLCRTYTKSSRRSSVTMTASDRTMPQERLRRRTRRARKRSWSRLGSHRRERTRARRARQSRRRSQGCVWRVSGCCSTSATRVTPDR